MARRSEPSRFGYEFRVSLIRLNQESPLTSARGFVILKTETRGKVALPSRQKT